MLIIGLVGSKGVGKDTTADYLVAKYGFTKTAFADPLKKTCEALLGIDAKYFTDPLLKEQIVPQWDVTPRYVMQRLGTDVVRKLFGEDFWIRHLSYRLDTSDQSFVVVSDVRFKAEADFVKSKNGTLVRVVRPTDTSADTHITETEQQTIDTDYVLYNTNSVDTLHRKIDTLIRDITHRHACESV